jgi:hypothetical protein
VSIKQTFHVMKTERVFSYRIGVLGFPGVAIPEKNLGLLDQRAAVEWLRDK